MLNIEWMDQHMSLETDFFGRYRPAFGKLEKAGFRKIDGDAVGGNTYLYEEDFLDGQFRAQLEVRAAKAGQAGSVSAAEKAAERRAGRRARPFVRKQKCVSEQ